MPLFRRIFKEFWLPASAAISWTTYNWYSSPTAWDLAKIINVFGPSFFLMSWASGQFFRVKKQALVEKNLSTIDQRLESVLSRLEQHARDFEGHTIGTQGLAHFMPMIWEPGFIELCLTNESKYPAFDIQADLIDLDEPIDRNSGKYWTRHAYSCATLQPSRLIRAAYRLNIQGREQLRINVFVNTRGGSVTQEIRVDNSRSRPLIAIRTRRGEETVVEIPDGFRGYDQSNPDAIFS